MAKILFDIVRSQKESDRESDFVALGYLDDPEFPHAAFIIQYDGELFESHFNGFSIIYNLLSDDYFHKITDTIHPDEVPSFIALCKNIKKKANPLFGYFYSGESYDQEGNHLATTQVSQRMTCVGFCLNVLKGFLEDDYLNYADWNTDSHSKEYLEGFCKKYQIDIDKISDSHRRISPLELLTSGFFINIPITKNLIDSKIDQVRLYLNSRLEAAD